MSESKIIGRTAARCDAIAEVYQHFLTQLASADDARKRYEISTQGEHYAEEIEARHAARAGTRGLIAAQLTTAFATLTLTDELQSIADNIENQSREPIA